MLTRFAIALFMVYAFSLPTPKQISSSLNLRLVFSLYPTIIGVYKGEMEWKVRGNCEMNILYLVVSCRSLSGSTSSIWILPHPTPRHRDKGSTAQLWRYGAWVDFVPQVALERNVATADQGESAQDTVQESRDPAWMSGTPFPTPAAGRWQCRPGSMSFLPD